METAIYKSSAHRHIVYNDIFDADPAMNISVLALDGVFDTGLATVLDTFATANELAQAMGMPTPDVRVSVVGVRSRVSTANGMKVPTLVAEQAPQPDWVIVPALGCKMPDTLVPALARPDVKDAVSWLRDCAQAGARTAAACIGTFVLGEAGLLDGREATTTWWLTPLFRQRYPSVQLASNRIVVPSGPVLTAGAGFSHVDLALWLLRQRSPELAAIVVRYLIVDTRTSQSVYMISDHLAHADPLIERFDRWVRNHIDQAVNLDEAAAALATSKRTLARRLHEVLGKTPIEYIQDMRVERAVHLLKTSDESVDSIATQVGYADGVTLRTLLRRRIGKGVRELRGLKA
jgi:transcriptional regulator GlxA family with amidase domain